jgi:predicted phage terminase large subunit-like protein
MRKYSAAEEGAAYSMLCKQNFHFFFRESFNIVNPGSDLMINWHVDLICRYLQAIEEGKIKRLIINIPPRSLKSTVVSISWPAWILGRDPSKRIICASYSQQLSSKLSLDTRHLTQSAFFKNIFPESRILKGQNCKNKFMLSQRGFRFATSVGGVTTGEGGDILIVDDPHNALDVNSPKKRQRAIDLFQQSFMSRLDSRKSGAVIIVMQRLHNHDLSGFLEDSQPGEWEVLKIPMLAQGDIFYEFNGLKYLFKKGEVLHSTRDSEEGIERLKKDLGSYGFSAQYLQDPISLKTGMIKEGWVKYLDIAKSNIKFDNIVQSWDMAIKSGDNNSYTVCTTWGRHSGNFYLLNVYRDKIEYPEMKRKILELSEKWKPSHILMEDKASGQALLQDLKLEGRIIPLVPVQVHKDKFTRFASVTPLFEYRRVIVDSESAWCKEYVQELLTFPNSRHDDQIDSTSQYLNYAFTQPQFKPRIRQL